MKKKSFHSLFLALILLFSGCSNNVNKEGNELNYDFGIISTISNKEDSVISYYNFNGELMSKKKLSLAWLGISFGSFGETDKFVYTKVDNKQGTVFELNKVTGESKLYDLSYNALTMYAEDEYIYYANSSTKSSTISKYDTLKDKLEEIEIEKCIVLAVYPYKENIYVSSVTKDMKSSIYILDKDTLKIKDKVDNNYSSGHFHIYGTNDKVYFANNAGVNDVGGSNVLTEYDTLSNTFDHYELDYDYLYDIKEYEGSLIITHLNPTQGLGKNVTVFDLTTKERKVVSLENDLVNSTIKDDTFISRDNDYVYIYSLPGFSLLNKINVSIQGYYTSTIFTK